MRSIFILLFFFCLKASTQTVIDYASLSNANCVWTSDTNVPATIDGTTGNVKHRVPVGEVNSGGLVYFLSNTSNSIGSEYRIEYNFKQNHSYTIVVNARSIVNSGANPNLRLTITGTTGTTTSCNGPASINGAQTGTLIQTKDIGNIFSNYSYTFNSLP